MTTSAAKKRVPRVVVFSTPTCPHCKTAKRYLAQKGIRYTDVDVSRDPSAARDMVRVSGQQGVPVITIDGRPIVGFDRQKIDRLLGLN
ncbi:MAG: glutathione S-transferase N-terminal domain-containing protein [Anaerolineae bacterium]|jgi:glutaredoxin-like YruB-family protein|nr:glutathione S-transferase N-terminal domain-containing protein [Anaerolineae bacterium]